MVLYCYLYEYYGIYINNVAIIWKWWLNLLQFFFNWFCVPAMWTHFISKWVYSSCCLHLSASVWKVCPSRVLTSNKFEYVMKSVLLLFIVIYEKGIWQRFCILTLILYPSYLSLRARVCPGVRQSQALRCASATPSPEVQTGKTSTWRRKPQRPASDLKDICFSVYEEACKKNGVESPRNCLSLSWTITLGTDAEQQMVSLWRQHWLKIRTGDVFNDVTVVQDRYDNLVLELECEGTAEAVSILKWNFS